MSQMEIFYNTSLPVGEDINGGRPCSIIHFDPKSYVITHEEHYNLEKVKLSKHAVESLARTFLSTIQQLYLTEEGRQAMTLIEQEKSERNEPKPVRKK